MQRFPPGGGVLTKNLPTNSVGRISSVMKTSCKLKIYVSNSLGWLHVSGGLHVSDVLFQLFGRLFFHLRRYRICEGAESVSLECSCYVKCFTFGPVLGLDATDIGSSRSLLSWTATATISPSSMLLYYPGYTQSSYVLTLQMGSKCAHFQTIK